MSVTVDCPNGCASTRWTGSDDNIPDCLFCGATRTPALTPGDDVDVDDDTGNYTATFDGWDTDAHGNPLMRFSTSRAWDLTFYPSGFNNARATGSLSLS